LGHCLERVHLGEGRKIRLKPVRGAYSGGGRLLGVCLSRMTGPGPWVRAAVAGNGGASRWREGALTQLPDLGIFAGSLLNLGSYEIIKNRGRCWGFFEI